MRCRKISQSRISPDVGAVLAARCAALRPSRPKWRLCFQGLVADRLRRAMPPSNREQRRPAFRRRPQSQVGRHGVPGGLRSQLGRVAGFQRARRGHGFHSCIQFLSFDVTPVQRSRRKVPSKSHADWPTAALQTFGELRAQFAQHRQHRTDLITAQIPDHLIKHRGNRTYRRIPRALACGGDVD